MAPARTLYVAAFNRGHGLLNFADETCGVKPVVVLDLQRAFFLFEQFLCKSQRFRS